MTIGALFDIHRALQGVCPPLLDRCSTVFVHKDGCVSRLIVINVGKSDLSNGAVAALMTYVDTAIYNYSIVSNSLSEAAKGTKTPAPLHLLGVQ